MMAFTREPSLRARVDHGRGLVDAAADRRDNAVDDVDQVRIVVETLYVSIGSSLPRLSTYTTACATVHQDIGDRAVDQQRLEGSQAQYLVLDALDYGLA